MKKVLGIVLMLLLVCSVGLGAGRITLQDDNDEVISATNPLDVVEDASIYKWLTVDTLVYTGACILKGLIVSNDTASAKDLTILNYLTNSGNKLGVENSDAIISNTVIRPYIAGSATENIDFGPGGVDMDIGIYVDVPGYINPGTSDLSLGSVCVIYNT